MHATHEHGITALGLLMLWIENHAVGLVGLAITLIGWWLQWEGYRLKRRELGLREREIDARIHQTRERTEPCSTSTS